MTTIELYLKCRKKPFVIELSNDRLSWLKENLTSRQIVTIGPITFATSEFLYLEVIS